MPESPKIGSFEYYERLYQVEEEHWWSRGMRDIAAGLLKAHHWDAKSLKVLDAGCGTGITLSWLERTLGGQKRHQGVPTTSIATTPHMVAGTDLSLDALQFCQRRGDFPLCQSSVLALPFQSGSFDLVVCNDVIQHLPGDGSDKAALGEFYRVLKPGGWLLLRTNSSQGMGNQKSQGDEDFKMYSLDGLGERVRQAGFHIIKATYANALLSIIPTVKRHLRQRKHQHYHYHGLTIRQLPTHLRWLNTPLYWLMKGEAWFLSRPSRKLPFGHTIIFLAQKSLPARVNSSSEV